jgi:hypothetical protein
MSTGEFGIYKGSLSFELESPFCEENRLTHLLANDSVSPRGNAPKDSPRNPVSEQAARSSKRYSG